MTHTPHELIHDFPEYVETIHKLKAENENFAKLYERYTVVNRDIHRAETDIEPVSDDYMEALREQRVALKDELYRMLKAS